MEQRLTELFKQAVSAGFNGIWINSYEQHDTWLTLGDIANQHKWLVLEWDPVMRLQGHNAAEPEGLDAASSILYALKALADLDADKLDTRVLLLIRNGTQFISTPDGKIHNPILLHAIQSAIDTGVRKHIVLFSYDHLPVPAELEKMMSIIPHNLPDARELYELATQTSVEGISTTPAIDSPAGKHLIEAASGLTRMEALNAFALSRVRNNGAISSDTIWELKAEMIAKSGLLEMLTDAGSLDNPVGFEKIAGLNALKEYVLQMFNSDKRSNKIRPQGVLLVGVPGSGKSMFAKSLGEKIGRPTIRLDVGRLMGGIVGSTEANTRRALKVIDAMAPCVVMIDEVEKALGGTNGSTNDSGVGSRLLGTILTWLSDHTSDVFVVFTANNIAALPPELFRAERVDGVFFLDLPGVEQKDMAWKIYTQMYALTPDQAVERPDDLNWTPAEIKSCCRQACLRDLTLKEAAVSVVPIYHTNREQINSMREWATNRCLSAETRGVYDQVKAARQKMLRPNEIQEKPVIRRRVTINQAKVK